MPSVEQNKVKRSAIGLRACDRDRAFAGFTLFAPLSGNGKVYLIDLDGEVVHTWQMPYPPGNYGYLTERGTYFYNGKTFEDSTRYISRKPWKGGAVLEADWNGRVLWEVRHPDHHHDGIRLSNGNLLLICLAPLPRDLIPKIKRRIARYRTQRRDVCRLSRRDHYQRTNCVGMAHVGAPRSRNRLHHSRARSAR
jgi:hypothetical protein